jgi:hypothetical protein
MKKAWLLALIGGVAACSGGGVSGSDAGQAADSAGGGGGGAGGGVVGAAGAAGVGSGGNGTGGRGGGGGNKTLWLDAFSVNDIVADPTRDLFYLSVRTDSLTHLDSVTAIESGTGHVVWSVPIGDEPYRLAISDDGAFLYAGNYRTAGVIRRVNLATRAIESQFGVGSTSDTALPSVLGIAVVPGSPRAVVAVLGGSGGVAVYDDGVRRANIVDAFRDGPAISFVQVVDATTAYGFNSRDTGAQLYKLAITASGIAIASGAVGTFTEFMHDMRYEGGWLFGEDGQVVDPSTSKIVGSYGAVGPVVSNSASNRTYILETAANDPLTINVATFDRKSFTRLGTLTVPYAGATNRIVRARDGMLAANLLNQVGSWAPVLIAPGAGSLGGTGGTGAGGATGGPDAGAASCGAVQPCGGDVVGTWKIVGSCVNPAALASDFVAAFGADCPQATATLNPNTPATLLTFAPNGYYTSGGWQQTSILTVPASCKNGRTCGALQLAFDDDQRYEGANCSGTDDCTCFVAENPWGGHYSGPYDTTGLVLSLGGTLNAHYCVQGSTLHITSYLSTPDATGRDGPLVMIQDAVGERQ